MPRQVLKYTEDYSRRISPRRTKFEVKGKVGPQQPHTQTQSPKAQPVGMKSNPLHFLHKKSNEEIIVHWTRAERTQQPHTQTRSPKAQPVGMKKNPLHFLHKKSNEEITVHWTRAERSQFQPIKLLPPW